MIRRVTLLALLLGIGVLSTQEYPAAASTPAQLPVIYVDPSTGTADTWIVFTGSGFPPGDTIRVFFISPTRELVRYANNPITVEQDGTFRLPVLPSQDLAVVPDRDVTVQLGRWIADFVLADDTYYEQIFVVVP
jgi:hypothetical protein